MSDTKEVLEGELVVVAKESGLEQTKVEGLLAKFAEPFKHAKQAIEMAKGIEVTREDQKDDMETARVARLELKSIRVDVEHTRKELKEQSLREGKAIDGMANIIKAVIIPAEEYLEKQEKFAERLAEERRLKKMVERRHRLSVYVADTSVYKFEDISDEAFEGLVKSLDDAKKATEAAEKKAREEEEARRLKEAQEQAAREKAAAAEAERIRQENEKLKAEAEAREIEIAKQRKLEEERLVIERAKQQAALAAEQAKAEEERKKREALESQQRAEAEAKAKEAAAAEEAQRKALLAPDKQKLLGFADVIDKIDLPNVSNREAGKLLDETKEYLARISKNLRQKASQL